MAAHATCTPEQAEAFTSLFADLIAEECGAENCVALPGFGSFSGRKHDEQISTDLETGSKMLIPPAIEIEFKPGGVLKKHVKEVMK